MALKNPMDRWPLNIIKIWKKNTNEPRQRYVSHYAISFAGEKSKKCNPSGVLEKIPVVIGGRCGSLTNDNWICLTN